MKNAVITGLLIVLQGTIALADRPNRSLLAGGPAFAPASAPTSGPAPGPSSSQAVSTSSSSAVNTNSPDNTTAPAASLYSNSSSVPAITSDAKLTGYVTASAFNLTEQSRFIDTLEANILSTIGAVTNVTINSFKAGSIVVSNTIAFTEADSAAANQAQIALFGILNSQDGVNALFGDSFGNVEVSNVAKATATNPNTSGVFVNKLSSVALVVAAAVTYFAL